MDFTNENNLIENQECSIFYSGDLYRKNSDRVFIVYGFGNNWDYTTEKEMSKQENGFLAKIRMLQYNNIHFCFRNSNYEWDNNNSANYTLPILEVDKNISQESITNTSKTENTKHELLNDILEESNTKFDYMEDFDVDALIEEILSPLLEERLYSFEEAETTETKNEAITDLLNNELSSDATSSISIVEAEEAETEIPVLNEESEFSMSELIEDLKNEIIETTNSLLVSCNEKNNSQKQQFSDSVSLNETDESSDNITNTIQKNHIDDLISTVEENEDSEVSSLIVDELLTDIMQIFDQENSEQNDVQTLNTEINGEDNSNTENDDTDKNNNDDNNTPSTLNDDYYDSNIIDDLDIDSEIDNEISQDTDENEESTEENLSSDENFEDSVAACTALTVRDEDKFVICSRKLSKFYMIRKKIKLAIYKLFYAIPRMIKKELNTNNSQK